MTMTMNNTNKTISNVGRTFSHTPDLADAYAKGGWIVVGTRNSTNIGAKGREQAVKDLNRAAEGLAGAGLDIRPFLPSAKEMERRLASASKQKSVDGQGRTFTNSFVEMVIPECRVIVLLSTGTARKLDGDGLQPFVARLTQIITRQNTVAVFCKRIDRLSRNAWALATAMSALHDGWVGDTVYGFRRVSGIESILIFFNAQQGEMEAETLSVKSRNGRVDATGTKMVDGQVRIGVSTTPPAGFGRVRLRTDVGSAGGCVLYLDDERWRPERSKVAYGLAEGVDSSKPASQVENVRFALRHLGLPGWGQSRVAKQLAARGFSTVGYRQTRGASATFPADRRADVVLKSILSNLDVYESGRLNIVIDEAASIVVTIDGCIPPDGPWATPADFKRIRRYLAEGGMRFDGTVRLVLTGLRLTANGVASKLVTADRKPRTEPPKSYRIEIADEVGGRTMPLEAPHVDAAALNDAVAKALIAAADQLIEFVPVSVDPSDRQHELTRELGVKKVELAHLEERSRDLKERVINSAGLAGTAILAELAADYEEIVTTAIPNVTADIASLEASIDEEDRSTRLDSSDLQAAAMAHLLASLRDPRDTTYRRLLKGALVDSTLTVAPRLGGGHDFTFASSLRIREDDATATIPVEASWVQGQPEGPGVRQVLDALAKGTPYRDLEVSAPDSLLTEICQHLGVERKDCIFLNVTDPRVLRVGMAVLHGREGRSDAELASALDVPEALVRRVARLWTAPKRSAHWLSTARTCVYGVIHAHLSAADGVADDETLAAAGISVVSAKTALKRFDDVVRVEHGWKITPCRWCGDARRAVSRLHEVDSSICLGCRRDRAGVEWPADPYDGYLVDLDAFISADLVTKRLAIETAPARWKARVKRPMSSPDSPEATEVEGQSVSPGPPSSDEHLSDASAVDSHVIETLSGSSSPA